MGLHREKQEKNFEAIVKFINSAIIGKGFKRTEMLKLCGVLKVKNGISHPIDNFRQRFQKIGILGNEGYKYWVIKEVPKDYTLKNLINDCTALDNKVEEVREIISADWVEISIRPDGSFEPGLTNVKYKNK